MNNSWVNQEIRMNQLNVIDITGYIQKEENMLLLDFPYEEAVRKFAARVVVEYRNYDRTELSTDQSWLVTDMYAIPSPMKFHNRPQAPKIVQTPDYAKNITYTGWNEWDMTISRTTLADFSNVYVHVTYTGNRAELYNGYKLCADDFNANVPWQIGLHRLQPDVEGHTLRMVIYPLSEETKIFFDVKPDSEDYGKSKVKHIELLPEYKWEINK
jgi:hypothetical protein